MKAESESAVLNAGEVDGTLLRKLYVTMLRIRVVEEALAKLLEENSVRCPTHLYTGQEAIATGVCAALTDEDYIFGGHRSHGHYLAKGGNLRAMMAEIFGKETGCSGGYGGSMHLVAPEVGLLGTVPLVAATIPIAVGTAFASKLRNDQKVSVSFFGDGATEEGHFDESVNFAGLFRLPVVFVCENNLYSSHMHILERRAEDNIIKSAEAHGIRGVILDGNDVVAVYQATVEAVARGRKGEGPTLFECRTYRWRGHVGPDIDMDVGVKRKDEMKEWLPRDPIARLRTRLLELGTSEDELEELDHQVSIEVDDSVQFAKESPYPLAGGGNHVFFAK